MVDDVFAVIADPTRRSILVTLSGGRRAVGELVEELGVSQPTVSKHLKVLRQMGLVDTEALGQKRFYSLTPAPLAEVSGWIEKLAHSTGAENDTNHTEAIDVEQNHLEHSDLETLPGLPTAPQEPARQDSRGILATLTRWGRRRSH